MNATAALGIDIGGTKIAAGLVELQSGRLLSSALRPTAPSRGGQAILADVLALMDQLSQDGVRCRMPPTCVGLAVPELVDRHGRIASHATLDWQTAEILPRLQARLPACLQADVRCAALAEARFGAGRTHAGFLYVTIGTGISCCLVQDGHPCSGAQGFSGTLASSPLSIPDSTGRLVSGLPLEKYSSGPAITQRFKALAPLFTGDTREVCARAAAGEAPAMLVVETAARALGAALGHLVNVLDPGAVILGGGLGLAGGPFAEALEKAARQHIWSPLLRAVPILPAETGANAGVVGAALAAAETLS